MTKQTSLKFLAVIIVLGIGMFLWKGREEVVKTYYPSGELKTIETYKRGTHHGKKKEFYESGNLKSEGNFINGNLRGEIVFFYENGKIMQKCLFDENGSGWCNLYYLTGILLQENLYKNGELEGEEKTYSKSGNLIVRQHYKNEQLEGQVEIYYESGGMSAKYFVSNGIIQGEMENYYESGKLASRSFWLFGRPHGKSTSYYENANIRMECYYSHGSLDRPCFGFNQQGKPAISTITNTYNKEKKESVITYQNGIANGPFQYFYKSGILASEGIFKRGRIDGIVKGIF